MLQKNLRTKSRQSFTASLMEGKNSRFIAVNHSEIPCDPETLRKRGKAIPIRFTLIRALSPGFSSAPYKNPGPSAKNSTKKPDQETKKTAELATVVDEEGRSSPAIQMWSFKKTGGMGDKGPRNDANTWTLGTGATLTMWIDEQRITDGKGKTGRYSDPIVPDGITEIPAFAVCEITIASRNDDRAAEGKGVKITSVRMASFSLYSCLGDLPLLGATLTQARMYQTKNKDSQRCLESDLETRDVPFFAKVDAGATVEDADLDRVGTVKIVNWGDPSIPSVDIMVDTLLRYTNSTRAQWAVALLDVAIACNALGVLVFSNDYWTKGGESGFRAVPIIDAEALLGALVPAEVPNAPVDTNDGFLGFKTDYTVEVDGQQHSVEIQISPDVSSVESGPPPPCHDLALVGPQCELQAAHAIRFNLISKATGHTTPNVWHGFFNASPCSILAPAGPKRKRLGTMDF